MLSSNLLNLIKNRRETAEDQQQQQQPSILESITNALGTIKERQPLCFLKWLYLLQSLDFSDVEFWRKQISSSSSSSPSPATGTGVSSNGTGNQDKVDGDQQHHVPWEEQTIQRGALFLYCEVVLSHLKVRLVVA